MVDGTSGEGGAVRSGAEGGAKLELDFRPDAASRRWLSVHYRTTLYASAARPMIRFEHEGGEILEPMPAALFGTGTWIGPVPARTRRIHVALPPGCSETDFSVTSCRFLSWRELLTLAWKRSPGRALLAAALGVVGRSAGSGEILKSILWATRLALYHEWRVRNGRGLDLVGLEAPRDGWRLGPHIRVIVHGDGEKAADAVRATVASLDRQAYPNWSLALVGAEKTYRIDRPAIQVERDAKAEQLWRGLESSDMILPISAGDTVSDYAMAALVEFACARPSWSLFYADEDSIDAGRHVEPELKPDWSPTRHKARPYIGRAIYVRRRALDGLAQLALADVLRPSTWSALFAAEAGPVGHIRRVLLTKVWKAPVEEARADMPKPQASAATATIIVPTRDRADLLAACLAGLEKTMPRNFDLLIVDNGSRKPATRRLLDRARAYPWVRILDAAGPFNFSALCNRAAEQATGQVLVFLNNDTAAMRPDWLVNLIGWAVDPEVGAVGAKLLYPSGRLQHAGLVLGLGGYAAHIDIGAPPAYPGYLDRFTVPHEVSAVTAACLAVQKSKFDAVGGFDAERFPVELGDVDLCLRLAQRGWKTILTPDAVLTHKESATRGRSNVARRYAAERQQFLAAWQEAVRDDPFFHPALSLTARRTSLDH